MSVVILVMGESMKDEEGVRMGPSEECDFELCRCSGERKG